MPDSIVSSDIDAFMQAPDALAALSVLLTRVSSEEIAAGNGETARLYTPADVTAQVRAQQVHWLTQEGQFRLHFAMSSIEVVGHWPNMLGVISAGGSNLTACRLLGSMPMLVEVVVTNESLNNTAIDNLLIDVDRNAEEHDFDPGTLDLSGNPGTPTSASASARARLTGRGWTLTYPVPPIPLMILNSTDINEEYSEQNYEIVYTVEGPYDTSEFQLRLNAGEWLSQGAFLAGEPSSGNWSGATPLGSALEVRARTQRWGEWGPWSEIATL